MNTVTAMPTIFHGADPYRAVTVTIGAASVDLDQAAARRFMAEVQAAMSAAFTHHR